MCGQFSDLSPLYDNPCYNAHRISHLKIYSTLKIRTELLAKNMENKSMFSNDYEDHGYQRAMQIMS